MQAQTRTNRAHKQLTQEPYSLISSKSSVPAWKMHARLKKQNNNCSPGNGPHRNEATHTTRYPFPGSSNDWHISLNNNLNFARTKSNSNASRIQAKKVQIGRATKETARRVHDAKWIYL